MHSNEAVAIVQEELTEALGQEVSTDETREALDGGSGRPSVAGRLRENQLLLLITFATAVVLGTMLSLVTGSWVFLVVASLVHAVGAFVVTALAIRLSTSVEKPDAVRVARLESLGMADPEQKLNDAIQPIAGDDSKSRTSQLFKRDAGQMADPNKEPAKAVAQQQVAFSPDSSTDSADEGRSAA